MFGLEGILSNQIDQCMWTLSLLSILGVTYSGSVLNRALFTYLFSYLYCSNSVKWLIHEIECLCNLSLNSWWRLVCMGMLGRMQKWNTTETPHLQQTNPNWMGEILWRKPHSDWSMWVSGQSSITLLSWIHHVPKGHSLYISHHCVIKLPFCS